MSAPRRIIEDNEEYQKKIASWQNSPVKFVEEVLGVGQCECGCQIDHQQKIVLNDVKDFVIARRKRACKQKLTKYEKELITKLGITVKSGKGIGKTALLAWCLIWMNFCFGEHVKSMVTAPNQNLLKDNLFGEIVTWVSHSKRVFGDTSIVDKVLGVQSLKMFRKVMNNKDQVGKNSITIGRTCSRNADEATQQATMQGYHDDYQIFGVDESFGMPNPVFVPLETTMSGDVNFMLLIGNPTRNNGYAYDTFNKHKELWVKRTMNAEESTIVTSDHIKRLKIKYKDYPNLYRVNVLGEFPMDDDDALIPFNKIMDAVDRYEDMENNTYEFSNIEPQGSVFGCDIGCGGDLTVVMKRSGIKCDVVGTLNERDTMVTARWIGGNIDLHDPQKVGVDGIAWGKGVLDRLREMGYSSTFVDARKRSSDKDRFKNLRAELYMKLAQRFIDNDIAIPNDERLIQELSVLKLVSGGDSNKVQIMSKRDMKKEGIESPNFADALMMTMYFSDRVVMEEKKDQSDRYRRKRETQQTSWKAV